jgi:hypothetical protein
MGARPFVDHRIISAVTTVKFVRDRMSHAVLRGCWRSIILMNMCAPTEEKSDDSKDGSYEEFDSSFHATTCWSNLPVSDNS